MNEERNCFGQQQQMASSPFNNYATVAVLCSQELLQWFELRQIAAVIYGYKHTWVEGTSHPSSTTVGTFFPLRLKDSLAT